MGASPSRGISVRNPEPPGKIIQITEDVAKRMTQRYGQSPAAEQHQQAARMEPQLAEGRPSQSQAMVPAQGQGGIFNVGAGGFPVVETVSAYEVRQQKEIELQQNDEFWTGKLKDLEARYVAAAFAAEGVFNKELEKLDNLVPKPKDPVCQEHTLKIAQCYERNNNQALKCSEVVKEFALCVERHNNQDKSSTSPSAAA